MRAKVVHLVTRLDLGGAQQNTLHTVRHLDRSKFEPVLMCGPGGMLDEEARSDASVKTLFVESLRRDISPFYDLLALLEIAKVLLAEKPDILHTHSSKAGILGRMAAVLAGVPIIVHTYHGFGFHERQPVFVKKLYVFLERLCARFTDVLVFVSRANVAYAAEHGIVRPADAVLIRSGVKLAGLPAPVEAAKLKMSAGVGMHKPLVLSVGNLKPQKNAGDFVSAAASVLAVVPEARFVFLGDGPQRRALEARAFALGLEGKVLFLGWRRDAAQWLAAADVFVMTSLWEGLPRALVEAMKSGLPAVCYATDGVTDLISDGVNGFLVEPGDHGALAARVTSLLNDEPRRKALGAAAAASIGPEFDIDGMVRSQEALYERLLDRRRLR
ncbi:MAG: glycosyltransferase family 4 protein [Elusimicrobia bacterium]|nr:glycosyltransferase family 4 protein [Elusimicrobiota bacterium]